MNTNSLVRLYSIKMRASQHVEAQERHISGAERIVGKCDLAHLASLLTKRALDHSKGEPDQINIKIEQIDPKNCLHIEALPVSTIECVDHHAGLAKALELLGQLGLTSTTALRSLINQLGEMRGAMLVDFDSYKRLEDDHKRGVRVTYLDAYPTTISSSSKDHYREALVLASKVASCPNIVAELCISDDPNYTTGYVAAKSLGYVRLKPLKQMGDSRGGRIFFFKGSAADRYEVVKYLEKQVVLVHNLNSIPSPDPALTIAQGAAKHATTKKLDHLTRHLQNLEQQNLLRTMHPLASKPNAQVFDGKRSYLLLSSNDYLGLAGDPRVCAAAAKAAQEFGAGSGGSRLTTGTLKLHTQLEKELAHFKKAEACLLFNTGYMANLGTIQALANRNSVIFSDSLNHASIIDGCKLSGAKIVVYKHNDMHDLEEQVAKYIGCQGLIVSDAVFSMDGDILNLPEFLDIANRYGLLSMIDEAHATGVLGATGRGINEYFGLQEQADVTVGTLSKALGSEGGFVTGKKELIYYLQNTARSFIFSTALSAAPVASALTALDILSHNPSLVSKLQQNRDYFCHLLAQTGKVKGSCSAIVPIMLYDEVKALELAKFLKESGCFLNAIRWPTVPKGQARIRCTLRSDHSSKDLERAAELISAGLNTLG